MIIFVGSTNPVKTNAVITAASETWPDVQVFGYEVPSGVSEQPMTDEETRTGSANRARAALTTGMTEHGLSDSAPCLGVGLEGGVFQAGTELWSTVWVTVVDKQGNIFDSNGARFKVPDVITQRILAGGEMGPIVKEITGESISEIKQKQGAIGIVTEGFVDRTEEYAGIAKLALGLWYGRNWYQKLKTKS